MPTYILKLTDPRDQQEYFLEWSTVVDAPVSLGMSRDDFGKYYHEQYGSSCRREYVERMARVDATGTSCQIAGMTAENVWQHNRAGPGETCLDLVGLIDAYCKEEK